MSEQVFYSWHHANAYETASEVVLDVTVYPNPGTMQVVRRTRLGSARLGSARLGSARLGSARLGSAWLGFAFELRSGHACTCGHAVGLPSLAA